MNGLQKIEGADLVIQIIRKCEIGNDLDPNISKSLMERVDDICCIFSRQTGKSIWRTITTHGSAWAEYANGDVLRTGICLCQRNRDDTLILHDLTTARGQFLKKTLPNHEDGNLSYPNIRGNVVLLGNLCTLNPTAFISLRELFLANGASGVTFITPAIPRPNCNILRQRDCDIVPLAISA